MELHSQPDIPRGVERQKALKIFARSIFRELSTQGFDTKHVVSLATELLDLACDMVRSRGDGPGLGPEPAGAEASK
jgi:hypothetical protein